MRRHKKVICPNSTRCPSDDMTGLTECVHIGPHDFIAVKNTKARFSPYPCSISFGQCPGCISIDSKKGKEAIIDYFEWLVIGNIHGKKKTKK